MGRPKKEETDKKLALLQTIKEKKSILFAQFSSSVEKHTIEAAWEEVLIHAKSLALVTDKRDVTYVRKLFSQWKSRTFEKKDNKRKTGTGGGKDCRMTEVDQIILDIVGKESPVVEGLPIGESGNYEEVEIASVENGVIFNEDEVASEVAASGKDDLMEGNGFNPSRVEPSFSGSNFHIKTKKRRITPSSEKDVLLEAKWKAQTELVKQQSYNLMLQNYKLEVELGLPHSEYTMSLKQF